MPSPDRPWRAVETRRYETNLPPAILFTPCSPVVEHFVTYVEGSLNRKVSWRCRLLYSVARAQHSPTRLHRRRLLCTSHVAASACPAGGLHCASSCCTENNRTFGNAPERDKAPDGQTNARAGTALYHRVPERHARMDARSTTSCRRLRGTGHLYGNLPVYRRPIEIIARSYPSKPRGLPDDKKRGECKWHQYY